MTAWININAYALAFAEAAINLKYYSTTERKDLKGEEERREEREKSGMFPGLATGCPS